jgi:hypothetical protein
MEGEGDWQAARAAVSAMADKAQGRLARARLAWAQAQARRRGLLSTEVGEATQRVEGLLKRKREAAANLEAAHQLVLTMGDEVAESDRQVQEALERYSALTCDALEAQNEREAGLLQLLLREDVGLLLLQPRFLHVEDLAQLGAVSRGCRRAARGALRALPQMITLLCPPARRGGQAGHLLLRVPPGGAVPRVLPAPPGARQLCAPMLVGAHLAVIGATSSRASDGFLVAFRSTAAGWCETAREDATLSLSRVTALGSAIQGPHAWEWAGGPRRVLASRAAGSDRLQSAAYPTEGSRDLLETAGHDAQALGLTEAGAGALSAAAGLLAWEHSYRVVMAERVLARIAGPELHAGANRARRYLEFHALGSGLFGAWSPRTRVVAVAKRREAAHQMVAGPVCVRPALLGGTALPALPPGAAGCGLVDCLHGAMTRDRLMLDANSESQRERALMRHANVGGGLEDLTAQGMGCNGSPLFVPLGPDARSGWVVAQDCASQSEMVLLTSPALRAPLAVSKYLLGGDSWPASFTTWARQTGRLPEGERPCVSSQPFSKQRVRALVALLYDEAETQSAMQSLEVWVDLGISVTTPARLGAASQFFGQGWHAIKQVLQSQQLRSGRAARRCLVLVGAELALEVDMGRAQAPYAVREVHRRLREQHPTLGAVQPFPVCRCNSSTTLPPPDLTAEEVSAVFFNDLSQLLLYARHFRLTKTTRAEPYTVELLCEELLRLPDYERPTVVPVLSSAWDRCSVRAARSSQSDGAFARSLRRAARLAQVQHSAVRAVPWGSEAALLLESKPETSQVGGALVGRSQLDLVHLEADGTLALGRLCPAMQRRSTSLCESMVLFASAAAAEAIEAELQ